MRLSQLVDELQKFKGTGGWKQVAQASGVDYDTVARIARGSFPNPGVVTCERIEDALEALRGAGVLRERHAAEMPTQAPVEH